MSNNNNNNNNSIANKVNKDDPPEFKRALVDIDVPVGTPVKFLVEIKSASDLRVCWYHNDNLVSNSERLILLEDQGIYCIQIQDVTPEDVGKWTCRADNAAGGMSCFAFLKIQIPEMYRAPEFVKGLRGCLWDNGTLSLECEVIGVPTPILRWYKDGKQLVPGAALKIIANSKLSKNFLGIFACEAENCMGSTAIFSKVYAKNFGEFLNQFRQKILEERSKLALTSSPIVGAELSKTINNYDNSDNDSGIVDGVISSAQSELK